MNKRPTPETDAVRDNVFDIWGGWSDNAAKKLLKHASRLEIERDEARERVKELTHENENLYRRLESVHEVYRLSSVCRELKAENDKLKQQQP